MPDAFPLNDDEGDMSLESEVSLHSNSNCDGGGGDDWDGGGGDDGESDNWPEG